MKLFRFLAFLCLVLAISTVAVAAEKGGVTMPDAKKDIEGKDLVLNGMGLREATVFNVDVYAAGLYLETKSHDGKAIAASEQTKQLMLHFVRDVDKDDIVGAWNEGFTKNGGADQAKIAQLNGWMTDMKDGDEMYFNFKKDGDMKVIVTVKGTTKGTITGNDFARVFLLIWLGDNPPNTGLREGLLGNK